MIFNIPSNESERKIQEENTENLTLNISRTPLFHSKESKEIISEIPNKDDEQIKSHKSIFSKKTSKSADPFRDTNRLKKNIDRINETLFHHGSKLGMIKIKPNIQENNSQRQYENKRIIERVMNTKSKLKLENLSKEKKINKKLLDFKNMDTFMDIQKFLKDINLLEDPEFKDFLSSLQENFKENRKNKPMAIEKRDFLEKIESALKQAKKKINEFRSQMAKKTNVSLSNNKVLNYLIDESEKNLFFERSELDHETNQMKNRLLNMPDSKNEDEGHRLEPDKVDLEAFKELEDIKRMLLMLGINLNEKKVDFFYKNTDVYFKIYKEQADKLRAYVSKLMKDIFKKKWIESHHLNSYGDSKLKSSQILNAMNSSNQIHNNEKNNTFITNLDNNTNVQDSQNRSYFGKSSPSLQTKIKQKLERLINSKNIFPFLINNYENSEEMKPQIAIKFNRSMTYSAINQKNHKIDKSASINKKIDLFSLNLYHENSIETTALLNETRKKAKTLHVKFGKDNIRSSIQDFHKISNDVLLEQRKSLRKSRKSVYIPCPFVNPEIKVDLSNIKKFDEIMSSIQERNNMVTKFQRFLNDVDYTKENFEKKTAVYVKNIDNVSEDMDILQEKMEVPLIESIRDNVYTNEYIENRNSWYKKKINKNLKNTIRLVLSQKK